MPNNVSKGIGSSNYLMSSLAGIGALCLILQSVSDANAQHNSRLIDKIFIPAPFDFWLPIMVLGIAIAFGLYVRSMIKIRNRLEQARQDSEKRFTDICKTGFDLTFTLDEKGSITYTSPASKAIIGYEPEEILGERFSNLMYLCDIPESSRYFTNILKGNESDVTFKLRRRDGYPVLVEARIAPVLRDDRVVAVQGSLRDITQRQRLEKELRKLQSRFERLDGGRLKVMEPAHRYRKTITIKRNMERRMNHGTPLNAGFDSRLGTLEGSLRQYRLRRERRI